MKRDNWPVEQNGIRPAGPQDACFYCGRKLGEVHKEECVIRTKTVIVDVTIRMERVVPEFWDKDMVEFHMNESSWCASNILDELDAQAERLRGCLCDDFSAVFIREATEEDEETYKLHVADCES